MTVTPNPESPLCLDLPKLFQKTGSVSLAVDWDLGGLSTTYSQAQHLGGEINAETSGEKILVTGKLALSWEGPCRRCLEITEGVSGLRISEIYEKNATEGETFEIPLTQTIDLEPMLHEQVLLSLPLTPLCSSDCKGPMPEEYPASAIKESDHDANVKDKIDPRWDVLGTITFDEKEEN